MKTIEKINLQKNVVINQKDLDKKIITTQFQCDRYTTERNQS